MNENFTASDNSTENSVKKGEIVCKIDVLAELKKNGYNTSRIRKEKIIAECTLTELRKGIIRKIETLAIICSITNLSVSDIIEFNHTENSVTKEQSEQNSTENSVIDEIPIEELNLPIHILNPLKCQGIETLSDFFTCDGIKIRKLPKYAFEGILNAFRQYTNLQYINVPGWKSYEEKKPEESYLYYCLWDDGHIDQRSYNHEKQKWEILDYGKEGIPKITHWRLINY